MQNQESEENCKAVKELNKKIMENNLIFTVKEMKPHILSDLCLIISDEHQGLPKITKCRHHGIIHR